MPKKATTTKKKTVAKKAVTKKAATKKVATKKAAAPNNAAAPKKAAAPKPKATKKAKPAVSETSIIANIDVGFGNSLFIRGNGAGLSWESGTELKNISDTEWSFTTAGASDELAFKFLLNDEIWADGEDLTVAAGKTSISSPTFS
jgi:membrane protein involved in colicin uptake